MINKKTFGNLNQEIFIIIMPILMVSESKKN